MYSYNDGTFKKDKKFKIKGKIKIPKKTKAKVKDIDFDAEDQEVEFEFNGRVYWKSPSVIIKDAAGNTYSAVVKETGKKDIEVKVNGLKNGETYTYAISGVKKKGDKGYTTVYGKFKAIDD